MESIECSGVSEFNVICLKYATGNLEQISGGTAGSQNEGDGSALEDGGNSQTGSNQPSQSSTGNERFLFISYF